MPKQSVVKKEKVSTKNDKLIIKPDEQAIISNIVLKGDISNLNSEDKVKYYNLFCKSLHLNPATQPFQIIKFRGDKESLYATKDATEQLRKINGVSITESKQEIINDIMVVKVAGMDKTGRTDVSTGAVNIKGLSGDALCNAIMKAETKAKRRLTLSICGLGILDETEIDTISGVSPVNITPIKTDELKEDHTAINKQIKDILINLKWNEKKFVEYIRKNGMTDDHKNLNICQKEKVYNMLCDALIENDIKHDEDK